MTKYMIPIFGNVNLYLGNTLPTSYLEGVVYPITDAQAALAEVTHFVSLGYLDIEANAGAATTYLLTFTSVAAQLAAGLTAVKKPLINTPAAIAAFVAGAGAVPLTNEASAKTGLTTAALTKAEADAALAGAEAADLSIV